MVKLPWHQEKTSSLPERKVDGECPVDDDHHVLEDVLPDVLPLVRLPAQKPDPEMPTEEGLHRTGQTPDQVREASGLDLRFEAGRADGPAVLLAVEDGDAQNDDQDEGADDRGRLEMKSLKSLLTELTLFDRTPEI